MLRQRNQNIYKTLHKYKNSGFSLIELIVVIAIITVVTSAALIGFNALKSGDASKASKSMGGELSSVRQNTLSVSGVWTMELINDKGYYTIYTYHDGSLVSKKSYGNKIDVVFHEDGVVGTDLVDENKILFVFASGSGKVKDVRLIHDKDKLHVSSEVDDGYTLITGGNQYFVMNIKKGGQQNGTDINLAYETGKVIRGSLSEINATQSVK